MPNKGGMYENDTTQTIRAALDLYQKEEARKKIKRVGSIGGAFSGGAGESLGMPEMLPEPDEGPVMYEQVTVADTATEVYPVADASLYSAVLLMFTFERDGRWGSGTIHVVDMAGGSADAAPGTIIGSSPNFTLAADVSGGLLNLHVTAEDEGGLSDLNLVFTTLAYTRRITP